MGARASGDLDARGLARDVEITAGCYRRCVEDGGCTDPREHLEFVIEQAATPDAERLDTGYFEDARFADLPMVPLERDWAATYCTWLGGRLPTNGEWERAARGVEGRWAPWGPIPDDPTRPVEPPGWRDDPMSCERYHQPLSAAPDRPTPNPCWHTNIALLPVGMFPPGPYGHHDLMGAPREWVADWWGGYPSDTVVDYTGPEAPVPPAPGTMVARGGAPAYWRGLSLADDPLVSLVWPHASQETARCAFDTAPPPMR